MNLIVNEKMAQEVCEHVLETEYDDFNHHEDACCESHAYFKAYAALFGLQQAQDMLFKAEQDMAGDEQDAIDYARDTWIDNQIDAEAGK